MRRATIAGESRVDQKYLGHDHGIGGGGENTRQVGQQLISVDGGDERGVCASGRGRIQTVVDEDEQCGERVAEGGVGVGLQRGVEDVETATLTELGDHVVAVCWLVWGVQSDPFRGACWRECALPLVAPLRLWGTSLRCSSLAELKPSFARATLLPLR